MFSLDGLGGPSTRRALLRRTMMIFVVHLGQEGSLHLLP